MAKGTSEARARVALKAAGLFVYKPPDDARNWKPCDFLTWAPPVRTPVVDSDTGYGLRWEGDAISRWVEVKQVGSSALTMPASDLRPSQLSGVAEAMRLGIQYWLLIYWKHPKIPGKARWTCLELTQLQRGMDSWVRSLPYFDQEWAAMGSVNECVDVMVR